MHQHLQALYREAAARLEGAGRIDEATYVYAELLNDVQGCVALLERHGRFETAARIAEQREIDAAVTVRLWWLAKDRKRAIAVARRHHAFAAAITRLEQSDPAAADSLRNEWIADLEQAGDLLGAVEVAWPKPSLRPLLINIIARGEDIGGPTGGAIKGYGLALKATDERIASATELLNAERDSGERTGFLSTFASVAAASPSADRRLATIFIRRNPLSPTRHDATTDWWWMIRKRADTALVADLPAGAQHQPPPPPILRLPDLPVGHLITVTDAAALPSGDVLVALGALGCRLVRRTGHTVAEWHMPTSHIVMADHGGRALLLDQRTDGEVDIRRLDLTTRRLDVYGTMEVASFSDSFDGAHWFVIDRGGAAIVDMTAGSPTIRWRPIDSNTDCHSLLRTANEVTALVTTPRHSIGGRGLELRTWNPTMTRLTGRSAVRFPPDTSEYQLVPNGFLVQRGEHLQIHLSDGAQRVDLGPGETAWSVGDLLVRTTADAERRSIRLQRLVDRADVLQHDLDPGEPSLSFRSHGTLVTAWDRSGRVHAIDLSRRVVLSSVRVLL
jgi:hypothetical protein